MSNTALAWLAIFLLVVPFGIVALADRVQDGPEWLDSEGFDLFMNGIAFVALMGLFPLVAANSHLVENGAIHLSDSVPVAIVSVVALVIGVGIAVALIGVGIFWWFAVLILLPYELVFRRLRRAFRITKQAGRDFDSDGYRIFRPPDYGIPYYKTTTEGKPAYLIHNGIFRKVCAVVEDEQVTYYNRHGDRISPPLLWGYSHRKFYGPRVGRLFTQYMPRRVEIGHAEAAQAVMSPPGA